MPAPNPAFGLGPSDGYNFNQLKPQKKTMLILSPCTERKCLTLAGVLEQVADSLNTGRTAPELKDVPHQFS